jgi:hypothetical protein
MGISERFEEAKSDWHTEPKHHTKNEIPPTAPKKSCMDSDRNSITQAAAQIMTGHWRSGLYLTTIDRRADDNC